MTAQSVMEDGQKQTQRQTDSLNEAGGKKNLTYINKEGNDNDGAAVESDDSQGWRCPVGGVSLRAGRNQSESAHIAHRRTAGR